MIRVVARMVVSEERAKEFLAVAEELARITRENDGPVSYDLVRALDDPTQFRMIEVWKDLPTLERHLGSEHFVRLIPQISALALEAPPAEVFEDVM